MDIAAALGTERLREIMTELVNRSAAVVQRYGGTVDKFTGDGIMAVFGAPAALEDHAFRACLAAMDLQKAMEGLAAEVHRRDDAPLQLRVGLNSGEVIAGEVGSGPFAYTAIGEQVGMAQRMESVAPAGGVMLSESTARLVEGAAVLSEPELVRIKGVDQPVPARRLVTVAAHRGRIAQGESTFVGRDWELTALAGMLDRSINGSGCVVGVVGPVGIGKSRIAAETASVANALGVPVFSTFCESHASEVSFRAAAGLLRAAFGVDEAGDEAAARARVRARVPGADPADLVLLDDMLGIRDALADLPDIAPDARRRRLTALVNAASLARSTAAVYVIEDVHWIDEISESLLADFLSVVAQTRSLVLITYRPEYGGALSRTPGAQTIGLAPLDNSQTVALITELLGPDPSVDGLIVQIAERAAGNPFFAEEIVRDLADRGVLSGTRGAYVGPANSTDVSVPVTLQAAIAARIDRLDTAAKRTLKAAAVIGLRFGADLLNSLVDDSAVTELIEAELIDQVMFTPRAEYAFRHPLIRTVAYRSQLESGRAELHRRLAVAIEQQSPESSDENAALIAEHVEAAGDMHAAFGWHMRAGTWSTNRDLRAARMSWQRARQVADGLPDDDPIRTSMRIAPRTLLCGSAWRAGGSVTDTAFDELRDLTAAADDKVSLAIGMAGRVTALVAQARFSEASQLSAEFIGLIESIGDRTLTVALMYAAMAVNRFTGEMAEMLRLAERVIELADGDVSLGNLILGSPLTAAITFRGIARCFLGLSGWKDDINQGVMMAREFHVTMRGLVLLYGYGVGIAGAMTFDGAVLQETAETLQDAERSGDDFILVAARFIRGVALMQHDGPRREEGAELLAQARDAITQGRFSVAIMPVLDAELAKEKARNGDLDGAIGLSRTAVEQEFDTGEMIYRGAVVTVLVELLLLRKTEADLQEAQSAIDRLAAAPTEPGFIVYDVALLRLRALLARSRGDHAGYRQFTIRYREMAARCGYEGHMATAEAM
jgi:adenylate cyclase